MEEKVKVRGAGKGGVRPRTGASAGPRVLRFGRREEGSLLLVLVLVLACVLLLREAIQPARGVLPTEVLGWGGPEGRGRGKMSGGKFESQLEGEKPKNQGDTAAKWTGGAATTPVNGTFWGWPKRIRGKGRGRGRQRQLRYGGVAESVSSFGIQILSSIRQDLWFLVMVMVLEVR